MDFPWRSAAEGQEIRAENKIPSGDCAHVNEQIRMLKEGSFLINVSTAIISSCVFISSTGILNHQNMKCFINDGKICSLKCIPKYVSNYGERVVTIHSEARKMDVVIFN